MPMQKEGVILAAEGADQFIKVLGQASKALADLYAQMKKGDSATASISTKTEKATSGFSDFFRGLRSGGMEAAGLKSTLAALSGGMGALGGIVGSLVVQIGKKLVGALIDAAKALHNLAAETARIQGMALQFNSLTQAVVGGSGAMLNALRQASGGMIANRDLMQQYNLAASLVNTQFAERLPEALSLLGKVSAATGQDLGYMMDSLVRGVGRLSPLILDNLGIQISLADATARAAEMFDKEAGATTKTEQQAALTELALEALEARFGSLPDAAQMAGSQTAILSAQFTNIKDTLGQFLLPAWNTFMQAVNRLVGEWAALISEGGALYPVLVNIGAALSIAADAFAGLIDFTIRISSRVFPDLINSGTGVVDFFINMAEGAVRWGADLITNFAVGIVDAANTVLTWAMQQIQNLLMWWLAPGSPPRVAPNLNKWGMAAFESYLQGMTKADFGILESIQSPLKKMLEGPEFANVTKAISGALAGGDRAKAIDILANSSRQFGDDVAELARREFALADATEAVAVAENALVDAQERAIRSSQKVNVETARYNEMLRSGAAEDALNTQLARINAAEKEAALAQKDAVAAGTSIDAAKERVNTLQEEVDWQKRFLDQLFGIQDALTTTAREEAAVKATAGAKAGAGAAGVSLPEAVMGGGAGPAGGIAGAIGGAIEDAKARMLKSLGTLWEDIKTQFTEKWGQAIGELGETWDKFTETVGRAWDSLKEKYPFLEDVETWVTGLPEKISTMITTGWDKLKGAIEDIYNFIQDNVIPILTGDKSLQEAFKELKTYITDTLIPNAWDKLLTIWTTIKDYITETLIPAITGEGGLGPVLDWLKLQVIDPLTEGMDFLKTALKDAHTWLGNLIDKISEMGPGVWEKVSNLLGHSPSPLAIGIQTAADAMERMARVSLPQFQHAMTFQPAGVGATYRPAGGAVTNQSNQFNFNTTNQAGIDAVAFEAMVLRTVRRALAGAA